MAGEESVDVTAPGASARAALTALPQEVLEMILNHLRGIDKMCSLPVPSQQGSCQCCGWGASGLHWGVQNHLALCCKATLPILGMGHVRVWTNEQQGERPFLEATRCLTKQPGGVSHLEVHSRRWDPTYPDTRHLIDLSLLSNLRKLALHNIAVSLPALQPIATRLRELDLFASRLQGSSDSFFTRGWTALTTLSLEDALVETASMTAALLLPALEELNIIGFRHQGGVLQLDQLTGSCPNIRGLRLLLESSLAQGRDGRGPCCSLLNLGQLADLFLCVSVQPHHASVEFDLPASLTLFEVDGANMGNCGINLFWWLSEAAKCGRRGAQLCKVTCHGAVAYLQPAQWGASLDEQYRRLGGQLSGLKELEVSSNEGQILCALSAVVSAAPSLTCVRLTLTGTPSHLELELSPICSASLETFILDVDMVAEDGPLPPVVLTFLPGCTRLQKVLVQFNEYDGIEGTAVRIRCHPCSPSCIAPLGVNEYARGFSEVGVQLLPGTPPPQGVQSCTVLHICHAIGPLGPQQPFVWCHAVMPGLL